MQDDSQDVAAFAAEPSGKPVDSERGPRLFPASAEGDGQPAGPAGVDVAAQGQGAAGETQDGLRSGEAVPAGTGAAGRDVAAASTGDPRVDRAVAALDGLAGSSPAEHVAVFESIHGELRQVLSELDSGPATVPARGDAHPESSVPGRGDAHPESPVPGRGDARPKAPVPGRRDEPTAPTVAG
ncbi:MAG TPA: hypothetical protein VGL63_12360 [Streptosporangiaceae bacterium]|jgi:hypothetical protein